MISICIPVYNFDCTQLIVSLQNQISQQNLPAEIVIIDDASTSNLLSLPSNLTSIRFIKLTQNIGRARIRNLFLQYVQFDNLLFLDCDGGIINPQFIRNYLTEISPNFKGVIVGGRWYPQKVNPSQKLHWKYGSLYESKSAEIRALNPYTSFTSNNFLIHKSVLHQIPFNENLVEYGHEDTLLGIQLQQNKIPIRHIANEVLNLDIETNVSYLNKTKLAVQNLAILLQNPNDYNSIVSKVKLAKTFHFLKRTHLIYLVFLLRPILLPLGYIVALKFSSTTALNLYKLVYLVHCNKK